MSRVRPVDGPTISLFPFLAVLLCTMGSLLVLLVLFSRSARQTESAEAVAARQAAAAELEAQRDEFVWRLEQLASVKARTTDDLARARMQLAGAEEDARALADELDALEQALATVDAAAPADDGTLADLATRVEALRGTIDARRADRAARPPAYAVVPYEGANGTHRRPLYIECCIDGVFLQPEGIRLKPSDFEGPPGPGNPLASALRAAREHVARTGTADGAPAAQPYPLLLVRPSGVMAYYAARESIQSWGNEFGYQFIDEDWNLTYPAPDPTLADVENRAIEEARRRLAWLQQVRPARTAKPAKTYRAATTRGGVVSSEGPSVLGDQSRWDWTDEQADGAPGGRPGAGGFGTAAGTAAGTGDVAGSGSGTGGGPGRGFRAADGDESAGGGDAVLGTGGGTIGGGMIAGGGAGPGGRGGDGASATGSRYAGPSRFYASEPDGGTGAPAGSLPGDGGPGSDATGTGGNAAGGDTAGTATSGGSVGAGGGTAASGGTAGSAASAASGSPGVGNGSSGGAGGQVSVPVPMPGLAGAGGAGMVGGDASASASLAGKRGSNWASLATRDRPIPLRRPIRVECAADEFRILADGSTRIMTRIPIGERTVDSVDLLVQAVHAEVGRWGLAGNRMYWKPELVLSETPDGRSRREDLQRLLADSGIDTRTTGAPVQVRPLPPVERAALRSR